MAVLWRFTGHRQGYTKKANTLTLATVLETLLVRRHLMLKTREFAQPQSGFSVMANVLLQTLGPCVVRWMRLQAATSTSTLNQAIYHCDSSGSVLYQPRAATCFREGWISRTQSPFLLRIPS